MSRPQLPSKLIRVKDHYSVEQQVMDFIKRRSMKEGVTRRKFVERILVEWCKQQGLQLVTVPEKKKPVKVSVT